jgi:hypothetical protein
MPFDDRDEKYKLKILFKRFPYLSKSDEGVYINSPKNNNFTQINDFIKKLNKPVILKERKHLKNLFELFDTYIYYHADKWFDPHPRLMLECKFFNKIIYYINDHNIKDGSYYRYHDLITNGLKNRFLDETDEIVKEFL